MCNSKNVQYLSSNKHQMINMCKRHGAGDLDEEIFSESGTFLFLTSWYEEQLFNNNSRQSPDTTKDLCSSLSEICDLSDFDFFGSHYCERYLHGNGGIGKFNNLRIRYEDRFSVKQSLQSFDKEKKRDASLLFAYLTIIYRYRNNFFHGSKGLVNLVDYYSEFLVNNRFLIELMSAVLSNGYRGYNSKGAAS